MFDTPEPGTLLVADSFRVRMSGEAAQVRGFSRHLDRFESSAVSAAANLSGPGWREEVLRPFLARARSEIASFGEGFPRLELWTQEYGQTRLGVQLRPLPTLTEALTLRTAPGVALSHPERKGPNIARLSELNRELGAEALLVDAAGRAVEGATTSILWWEDQVLCRVEATGRVNSVTELLTLDIARSYGYGITSRAVSPVDFSRKEAWALNALHGIRPVSTIDGAALPAPDTARLAQFRSALDQSWEPVLDSDL